MVSMFRKYRNYDACRQTAFTSLLLKIAVVNCLKNECCCIIPTIGHRGLFFLFELQKFSISCLAELASTVP